MWTIVPGILGHDWWREIERLLIVKLGGGCVCVCGGRGRRKGRREGERVTAEEEFPGPFRFVCLVVEIDHKPRSKGFYYRGADGICQAAFPYSANSSTVLIGLHFIYSISNSSRLAPPPSLVNIYIANLYPPFRPLSQIPRNNHAHPPGAKTDAVRRESLIYGEVHWVVGKGHLAV